MPAAEGNQKRLHVPYSRIPKPGIFGEDVTSAGRLPLVPDVFNTVAKNLPPTLASGQLASRRYYISNEQPSHERRQLIDFDAINAHLTEVATHYLNNAPTVSEWADTLYRTLSEDTGKVTIREIITAQALLEEGQWEQPNLASNRIYKLMESMKQDTTGHAGF